MTVDLVFITYNRLDYTRRALVSILADPTKEFCLTIWDNGSTDGTVEYLRKEVNDTRIVDVIFSKRNIGQTAAVNNVWSRSRADLLGKVDNDCLVTPGWTRTLAQAHSDIDKLGVVACWHFFADDFDYERAKHKIQTFGDHQIFRHPWTCGTGLLIKRETFKKLGPIQDKATARYWLQMAVKGYINGFYYPLIYQEHMDDPRSSYCRIRNEETYRRAAEVTFGLQAGRYRNTEGRLQWREEIVRNLLDDPFDPRYYVGWWAKLRRLNSQMRRVFASSVDKEQIHDFNG